MKESVNYLQMSKEIKTTSPKGGKRGCLCKDNTYNSKCCNGKLREQGIGTLVGQGNEPVNI